MKLYAELATRRTAQVAGDLLLVGWVVLWVSVGRAVYASVSALAGVGEQVESGGADLSGQLGQAGERVSSVPLVGDALSSPFDQAAGAASAIAEAGRSQQEAVAQLALLLGCTTALVPIVIVLLLWLPRRVTFVRRAGAARRHLDAAEDLDLFALRAMAGQPMHRLAAISDDPVGAWRRGDPQVIRRLADLELRASGLRVPAGLQPPPPNRADV